MVGAPRCAGYRIPSALHLDDDYQDPGNNDDWFKGNGTFASVVAEIAETVREHALEEDD
jgi:hypothetical protein